jgi:hypothetical protein
MYFEPRLIRAVRYRAIAKTASTHAYGMHDAAQRTEPIRRKTYGVFRTTGPADIERVTVYPDVGDSATIQLANDGRAYPAACAGDQNTPAHDVDFLVRNTLADRSAWSR